MKKHSRVRFVSFLSLVLIALTLLSACGSDEAPRLPAIYTYNPGAAFTSNINDPEPRKLVKCAVVFEVYDEAASTDLVAYNSIIRNSVLVVLGELTSDELTENRDLNAIAQRIVNQVNAALGGRIDIVTAAYFTEFTLT